MIKRIYKIIVIVLILSGVISSLQFMNQSILATEKNNDLKNPLEEEKLDILNMLPTKTKSLDIVENPPIIDSEIEDKKTNIQDSILETEEEPTARVESQDKDVKKEELKETNNNQARNTGGNWFVFNSTTKTIEGYSSSPEAPKNITIPSHINGVAVLYIANNAFAGLHLTGLTLSEGLLTIGTGAFANNVDMGNDIPTLIIPSTVTAIGTGAFEGSGVGDVTVLANISRIEDNTFRNSKINSITFSYPNTLTRIGLNAFNSSSLTSINIPNNVTFIGSSAFANCRSLSSVTLSNKLTSLGTSAFTGCSNLRSIIIPGTLLTIPSSAFYGTGLSEVTISNGVKTIGTSSFASTRLTTIIIPGSVTSIMSGAFNNCSDLIEINLPETLSTSLNGKPWGVPSSNNTMVYWKDEKRVGDYIFNSSTKTIVKYVGSGGNVTIPSSIVMDGISYDVEVIGGSAFEKNTSITGVIIPNGIKSIGSYAFDGCVNIADQITIPDSVTKIGTMAFYRCNGLQAINIPTKISGTIEGAPWSAPSQTIIYWKDVKRSGDYLFSTQTRTIIKYLGAGGNILVPETLSADGTNYTITVIGKNAFSEHEELTAVEIPGSITIIDDAAFASCRNLSQITLSEGLSKINYAAFWSCPITTITIPSTVTQISTIFSYNSSLLRVDVSNRLAGSIDGAPWGTTIDKIYFQDQYLVGNYVFNSTTKTILAYVGTSIIGELNIPSTIMMNGTAHPVENIGNSVNGVFNNQVNITSLVIPDSVKSIGSYTFQGCSKLRNIRLGNSVEKIGDYAFKGTIITSIDLPSSITTIAAQAFDQCKYLNEINVSSKNKGEINYAPWGAEISKVVVYWKGVSKVGDYAFDSNNNEILKYLGQEQNITIPSSMHINEENFAVEKIGQYAFQSSTVKNVNIPSSVKTIGDYAFQNSAILENIVIPEGVEVIGRAAFQNCVSLLSVTIPNSVTSIMNVAFQGCSKLKTVQISSNINQIGPGTDVFVNTPALQSIFVARSRESIPDVVRYQPWGANNAVKVYYAGDAATFEHTVERIDNQYARDIKIKAFVTAPFLLRLITLPDGTTINTSNSTWPDNDSYTYRVTSNGTYTFKGEDMSGTAIEYSVVIDDIGAVTVNAYDGTINEYIAQTATKQDILTFVGANAYDELSELPSESLQITDEDMARINALTMGQRATIRITATSSNSGVAMTGYKDVTLTASACMIEINNHILWSTQAKEITKQGLISALGVTVTFSDGTPVDMSKIEISDNDLASINTGIVDTYSIWIRYDGGIGRRRVEINILDDSPQALIQVPQSISMNKIEGNGEFIADANEQVKIAAITDTSYFTDNFYIKTDPSYKIVNQDSGDKYKVQVYDESNNKITSSNDNLAILNGSVRSKTFTLKAYQNINNRPGTYQGVMHFYITYGGDGL